MYARGVQEVETRLVELRHDELQDVALGGSALVASLVATAVYPPLVVPLFVGGLALAVLGVRAIWRHWDLVDRLADDRDAHRIAEVRAYAAREASMGRRAQHAALIRSWMQQSADSRIAGVAEELAELARELEDADLELDPAPALACRRLLTDPTVSPLLDTTRPTDELRNRIARIRSGFRSAARG